MGSTCDSLKSSWAKHDYLVMKTDNHFINPMLCIGSHLDKILCSYKKVISQLINIKCTCFNKSLSIIYYLLKNK